MDASFTVGFSDSQTFCQHWQQDLFMVDPEKVLPLPGEYCRSNLSKSQYLRKAEAIPNFAGSRKVRNGRVSDSSVRRFMGVHKVIERGSQELPRSRRERVGGERTPFWGTRKVRTPSFQMRAK